MSGWRGRRRKDELERKEKAESERKARELAEREGKRPEAGVPRLRGVSGDGGGFGGGIHDGVGERGGA